MGESADPMDLEPELHLLSDTSIPYSNRAAMHFGYLDICDY